MRFVTAAPPATLVHDVQMVEGVIRRCRSSTMLGIDTETLGKKYRPVQDQIVVMGLSPDEESRFLVPRKFLHHFQEVIEDPQIPKAISNPKFDAHRFANAGLQLAGRWVDTVTLDWLFDEDTRENRHGLKQCMNDYFGIPMRDYEELFGKVDITTIVPGHELWEKFIDYSSLDPWAHRKLALHLLGELDKIHLWHDSDLTLRDHYWDQEEPQLKVLYNMERRGILIDVDYLHESDLLLQKEMEAVAAEMSRLVGTPINPGSADQMKKLLFEDLGLQPLAYTPTGKPQLREDDIDILAAKHPDTPELKLIVEYRKASKARGTTCEGLMLRIDSDGRLRTTYNNTMLTGRISSSDPNLQNIKKVDEDPYVFRQAFVAAPGCVFVDADYSQLEVRLLAELSGDEDMQGAIQNGLDVHSFVTAKVMGRPYDEVAKLVKAKDKAMVAARNGNKAVTFGLAYGQTEFGLADKLGVSVEKAREIMEFYFSAMPGIRSYVEGTLEFAHKWGFVQTICGRFRRLSKLKSNNWRERKHAENQAINTPIQGSAADIVKKSMIALEFDEWLKSMGVKLLLQVHDELLFEVPEEVVDEVIPVIKWTMENPFEKPMRTPLISDPGKGKTWAEAK